MPDRQSIENFAQIRDKKFVQFFCKIRLTKGLAVLYNEKLGAPGRTRPDQN
jgi:hypothetical protein